MGDENVEITEPGWYFSLLLLVEKDGKGLCETREEIKLRNRGKEVKNEGTKAIISVDLQPTFSASEQ
jgi:hypothetical protein